MNREEAIEILKDLWRWEHPNWLEKDIRQALEKGIEALENQKTGHWIKYSGDGLWKCSECGEIIYSETEQDRKENHKFCSMCGAKMLQ